MSKQAVAFKPLWPLSILAVFYSLSVYSFFVLVDEGIAGTSLSEVQYDRVIPAERGQILDRHGLVLAEDRVSWDLVVNFKVENRSLISNFNAKPQIWTEEDIRERLSDVAVATGLSVEQLYQAVMVNESASQLLLSNIAPFDRERIKKSLQAVRYSGLNLVQSFKRIRPNGPVLSHFVGLLKDGEGRHGRHGLEARWDSQLSGADGGRSALTVGAGHGTNPALGKDDAVSGASVRTTLDLNISSFAREQLVAIMEDHDPMHCVAIVVDVNSGDILSAQGLPDYDLNDPESSMEKVPGKQASEKVYVGWNFPGLERISPGSTLKPLVAAWALENKSITTKQMFSNKGGAYSLPGRVIHNSSKYRNEDMNYSEAIVHSSNIVMAQIGRAVGREKMAGFLTHFGYGKKANQLPGLKLNFQDGKYPDHAAFMREKGPDGMVFTIPSLSFGREIEVSIIDHAMALASIANGGMLLRAKLDFELEPIEDGRVMSEGVAENVRNAMHDMIMYESRKWLPHRNDFNYCGKSGTSKHVSGPAKDKYTSLFVAYGPLEEPEVLVLVVAFGTHGTQAHYYGSQVCGPAAANILQHALKSRGTLPSSGLESGANKANLDQ
jgi:stage V sporulation protein D (sporulation-specific penicillin-binding protein)